MTSKNSHPDRAETLEIFLNALREGAAPYALRLQAARGHLPLPLSEKLEVLVKLTSDPSQDIRRQASQTLQDYSADELSRALADPSTPACVAQYFVPDVTGAPAPRLEARGESPGRGPEIQLQLSRRLTADPEEGTLPDTPAGERQQAPRAAEPEETGRRGDDRSTVAQKLSLLDSAGRIKRALKGNQEERAILIRDSNKMVARTVLQSPQLSDSEVETFASSTNVTEEVLRLIGTNRAFTKHYGVVRALVNNPRVPIDVSLPLVRRLSVRDLKSLAINRNVPDALRVTATRHLPAGPSSPPPPAR